VAALWPENSAIVQYRSLLWIY